MLKNKKGCGFMAETEGLHIELTADLLDNKNLSK